MTMPLPVFRLLLVLAALLLAGTPSRAQNIVVMVNGDPITDFDIEQRSKLDQLTTQKMPARQDVINELIDDRVKLKEGKKYGVDPGVSDINQSYEGMAQRMRISPDQLTKSLEIKGVRPETLKTRMKAEMVWTSLVRGRFKEKLMVGEKDVAQAVQAQTGDKLQIEGTEYKMQPIVLIVPRGSSPAFLGDAAQGSRAISLARRKLRRSQFLVPFHAERHHPRHRHQDHGGAARGAAQGARRHADRPPDRARGDQGGHRDGGAVLAQADHDRHAEEARGPREDVSGEVREDPEDLSR
ncbi:hypothetical protein ACVW0I_003725 [Bradyrhizobium sp. LM6.11]